MRAAVAMIELIFAIMVMAIAMLSVPIVLQQAAKSDAWAIQQEAVMLAATQIAIASTLHWDENSPDSTNPLINRDYILDAAVNTGRDGFGRALGTQRVRIGTYSFNTLDGNRRLFHNTVTAPSTLGTDTGEGSMAAYDDIDDFDGYSQTLSLTGSNSLDYKLAYTVSADVDFVSNTAPSTSSTNSTHIKRLRINVSSTIAGETYDVNMSAFFCNIGTAGYLEKL